MFSIDFSKSGVLGFFLHSFQNSTVALNGFSRGGQRRILLGRRTASPTTSASPTSKIGRVSIRLTKLSGMSLLTVAWSLLLVSRRDMMLLHWLRIVGLTSEGRWLTIKSATPYLRPSLAIFSKFSIARCSTGFFSSTANWMIEI